MRVVLKEGSPGGDLSTAIFFLTLCNLNGLSCGTVDYVLLSPHNECIECRKGAHALKAGLQARWR